MEDILRIVMELVATGVGVLLLILIKRIAKKYGFELKEGEETSLLAVMTRIVLHVEEEAAKGLKLTGRKWESWRKFNDAFKLFMEEVPGHTKKKVTQLVNEALYFNKLGATISAPKVWPEVAGKPPEDSIVIEDDDGGTD